MFPSFFCHPEARYLVGLRLAKKRIKGERMGYPYGLKRGIEYSVERAVKDLPLLQLNRPEVLKAFMETFTKRPDPANSIEHLKSFHKELESIAGVSKDLIIEDLIKEVADLRETETFLWLLMFILHHELSQCLPKGHPPQPIQHHKKHLWIIKT